MEKLKDLKALLVKQKVEYLEVFTGFETKNKYSIMDTNGSELFWAAEKSSFLARLLLRQMRTLKIYILDSNKNQVLTLRKPFRFFFSEINVFNMKNEKIGWVKQKFSIFSKKLIVTDKDKNVIYKIKAPFFHPWTFKLLENDQEVGKISKKWSGLGKEMFTSADNFNVIFPDGATPDIKAILLGALFLIDMVYFERK